MKKIFLGVLIGAGSGVIDVIPMMIQKLSWDANISAFLMWIVVGFFLSVSNLKMNSAIKGIVISFLILLPAAVLIGWKEPMSLLPISIMTIILGGFSGLFIEKLGNNTN